MKPHGSYRIPGSYKISGSYRPGKAGPDLAAFPNPLARSELRTQRILQSLRDEIIEGGVEQVRVRQVFRTPREIYRLELELPQLGYQRTILLDRDALEELLEADEVRAVVSPSALLG
jgi:hypothetical protein